MKHKLGVAWVALSLAAAVGCHKNDPQPEAATGISNSSGSFAPNAQGVPGTETDATGVGATGVPPNEVAEPPTNVPTTSGPVTAP